MARKMLPYMEGDWFAVPLHDQSFAIGRVVRIGSRGGVVLGFFFGPRLFRIPTQDDLADLKRSDVILIKQFCDPGLLDGSWPIIYRDPSMDRREWSQTRFGYMVEPTSRYAMCREYNDTDPFELISDTPIGPEIARQLPEDGLSGHIALQRRLDSVLK